jgi:hypothetical protein
MNRYLYLILGLIFVVPTIVVAIWRRDLRGGIISTLLFGALWGPISEFWFFRDYWHPASVLGSPILEDVIYGAGISATAWWIYKVVFRRTNVAATGQRSHYGTVGAIVVLYVFAMITLEMILGVNSILVAIGVYLVSASYIVIRRRDLIAASIYSAALMGLIALLGYVLGLNFLVPEPSTISHLWLLYHKPLGITILGYVPLTEVAWYTAWGSLLGIAYEFATGRRIVPLKSGPRRSRRMGSDGFDAVDGSPPDVPQPPQSPVPRSRPQARPGSST